MGAPMLLRTVRARPAVPELKSEEPPLESAQSSSMFVEYPFSLLSPTLDFVDLPMPNADQAASRIS
jgi:hypothetical protein